MVDVDLWSPLSSIEEVAKCPVCLEMVKPPVTLCVNGHGVCTPCKATLTKCPTCRKPFCSTEPRILNDILRTIPKVCKYFDHGCRISASDDHELYCEYRTVKCIFHEENSTEYCEWEGLAHSFYDHTECKRHFWNNYWSSYTSYGNTKMMFCNFKDFSCTKSVFYLGYFDVNQLFIFHHSKIKGIFCLYIENIPLRHPDVITYFTLSFKNSDDEVVYQYKMKAATVTMPERDVKVEDNVHCMRVPVEELEKLVDENGTLCMHYKKTTEPLQLEKVDVDLRSRLSSIEEVAKCPVCLELVKPPVTLCVNGHGVCTPCKATLTKCPTCRKPFCTTEPRILNEILQKIPKVCKYYNKGCRNSVANDHELYCIFRSMKCIFHKDGSTEYCKWEGSIFALYCHSFFHSRFNPSYDGTNVVFGNFKDFSCTKSLLQLGSRNEIQLFIFHHSKIKGIFCLYIEHFLLTKPEGITYFTLSFRNSDEVVYQYKMKAVAVTMPERDVKVEDNLYCMRVPVEQLEKLVDSQGTLCMQCKKTTEPL